MYCYIPDLDTTAELAESTVARIFRDLDPARLGPIGKPADRSFRASSMLAGYIAEREPLRQQLAKLN
jgi:hypothetical protein